MTFFIVIDAHAQDHLPKEICYYEDEIFSDVMTGYLAYQGQYAIQCDMQNQTDEYFHVASDVIKNHKEKIGEFSKPFKKFCTRIGVKQLECLEDRMLFTMDKAHQMQIFENCETFKKNLVKQKGDWKSFISQVFVITALIKDQYPACE